MRRPPWWYTRTLPFLSSHHRSKRPSLTCCTLFESCEGLCWRVGWRSPGPRSVKIETELEMLIKISKSSKTRVYFFIYLVVPVRVVLWKVTFCNLLCLKISRFRSWWNLAQAYAHDCLMIECGSWRYDCSPLAFLIDIGLGTSSGSKTHCARLYAY